MFHSIALTANETCGCGSNPNLILRRRFEKSSLFFSTETGYLSDPLSKFTFTFKEKETLRKNTVS